MNTLRAARVWVIATLAGLATLAAATSGHADRILHEYVPPPGQSSAAAWARQGQLPRSIRAGDQALPRPKDPRAARSGQERVLDANTALPDQTFQPDRSTSADGMLHYQAVFNPSVVPFKRGNSLDSVGPRYALRVRDSRLHLVRPSRSPPSPDRDLFWGSLVLRAGGGTFRIPSVAPDAKIISYRTTPSARVLFYKDSADNFWVKVQHPQAARGTLRLVFLTAAPKRYFSPQIPPSITTADVPPPLRPTLPSAVRKAATRVIKRVGVKRRATIYNQLERLIAYFRNFKPGKLPRLTGNTYLDIALSQQGVCRHRSFAFVITAQALGIPARFVHNDAHAFTEVFIPRYGWVRVDLGGASQGLQVYNAQAKAVHNPGVDPFPRPSRFTRNYSRLTGSTIRGVRPSQRLRRTGRRVALRRFDRSRQGRGAGQRASGASGAERPSYSSGRLGSASSPNAPATDAPGDPSAPGDPDLPGDNAAPAPRKTPTQITAYTNVRSVYRGEQIAIWGSAKAGASGAPALKIEIYLSQQGRSGQGELLGATVTDADGNFRVGLPVPRQLKVGEWQVYAATNGNRQYEAAISR